MDNESLPFVGFTAAIVLIVGGALYMHTNNIRMFSSSPVVIQSSPDAKITIERPIETTVQRPLDSRTSDVQIFGLYLIGGITLSVMFYFLPTIIARSRGHHNTLAIFILNFFLGWTFVGWVAALVWSFTVVTPRPRVAVE